MLEINWNPSRRELRQFATIWLPAFAALAGFVVASRSGSSNVAIALWSVAAASLMLGVAKPELAKPLFLGLTLAAYPIGWIVSHVVLGIIYYGLFTFVAVPMRIFRYDPLNRASDPTLRTYWLEREGGMDPGSYFRQF